MHAALYLQDSRTIEGVAQVVARRPVAVRTVLACLRAGARQVGLPANLRDALGEAVSSEPRLASRVTWLDCLDDGEAEAWRREPVLLVPAHVLVSPRSLERLLGADGHGAVVLEEGQQVGCPVVVAPPALTRSLWDALREGTPLGDPVTAATRDGTVRRVASGEALFPVADAAARVRAEAALVRTVPGHDDSWVDRRLNRRLSRWLTRYLIRLPVHPNAVTLSSLVLGGAAAMALAMATPLSALIGLALYVVAVVADHSDGEVARLTLKESQLGAWLDRGSDIVTHAMIALAMGFAAARGAGPLGALTGVVAATGVILSALFTRLVLERDTTDERVIAILRALGTRDVFYAWLGLFALSVWLAPAALPILSGFMALGTQVFWVAVCIAGRGRS